jgi:GTP cyclohydrolase I
MPDKTSRVKPPSGALERLPDAMADVGGIPGSGVPLQQVGCSNFRLPLRFRSKGGSVHTLETSVTGTVSLKAGIRGINMGRIVRIFHEEQAGLMTFARVGRILSRFQREIGAAEARLRLVFSYPMLQTSLISGLTGWQHYRVAWEGAKDRRGRFRRRMEFDYVYSSTCPSSSELAEHARRTRGVPAVPHSQRSRARIRVTLAPGRSMTPEDLKRLCDRALRTETQVIVKREDEQAFAVLSGLQLKFVEDASRLLHRELSGDPRVADFEIVCVHFESLHSHDAVSVVCKGVPGGFTGESVDFG